MKTVVQLAQLLFIALCILALAACDAHRQPQTVVQVVEVTATPSSTATSTALSASVPTALPDHLAVTLPGNLDNFPPGDPFVLHFNQPMDTTLTQPLTFSPALRGTAVWSDDATTLTFTPDEGFSSNRRYTVALSTDIRSASGQTFTTWERWQMQTLTAPFVAGRTPARPTTTDRLPIITLRFNQPMDTDSVVAALHMQPPLTYDLTVISQTATMTLTQPLDFGVRYQFTLDKTAVNQDHISLTRPYIWNLALPDPLLTVRGPSASDPAAPITIHFNYAMDAASVSQALEIKPDVQGKLAWNANHTALTLTPDGRLHADTTYTVNFTAPLLLQDGSELPPLAAAALTTPPPILSFAPTGSDQSPATIVRIRFDRLMDEAATEAAFTIEPAIDGSFEWQETTLTFHPTDGFFTEYTDYTVTLAETARSADGEEILDVSQSWHFDTGRFQEVANFGYGPNAQVLDVNGRRAIQYQIITDGDKTIGFELYRLDLVQFLDRYASNFKVWQPWSDEAKPHISLEDAEMVLNWQEQSGDSPAEWANIQEVIIPADVSPGLYILNLTVGRVNDQLILVLTENTLAVKEADGQIVAWVTDINGDPAAGIDVGVYARSGDLLSSGAADENGVYRTQLLPFVEGGPAAVEPLIVVAGQGEDVTVSGLSGEWQNGYGSRRSWWDTPLMAKQTAVFITTDRPIYKPGHEVQFKAIVRLDEDAALSVPPAETPITVRIRDGRNNVVQTYELATNDFGTVNGTFQLAEGAMLGDYYVEVAIADTTHRQHFKVEDYRKPDYEVTIGTNADTYLLGDTIEVTVDTAYYFGEPVPNASVVIRRFNQGYEWGSSGWYEDYDSANRPITERTDANGRFTTTIFIPHDTYLNDNYNYYWERGSSVNQGIWGIEATVDDGSHQSVSGFAVVTLYDALEMIRADFGGYVQTPGQPFIISADVQTVFGEPVVNRVLTVELARWQRSSRDYDDVRQTAVLTTDSQGHTSTQFTIAEPGHYQLRLKGVDANGEEIQYTSYVYAFSDIYSDWYGRDEGDLRIDTDKTSYAPGETAQLIIESAVSGPALLTWERAGTHREQLINLTAPLTLVDVPIEASDVPNIYVAVNVWQPLDTTLQSETYNSLPDGRLITSYHNISVPATTKRLNVTITPDKAQYAPREEATFTVRVTNYQGEPVSAELSLALVDEAIFALSPELSGPMYDAFYYERGRLVNTYNSLQPSRYLGGGGMGGGGGDGAMFPGGPRADFPDTAAWFPTLYTDFNGEVQVTITLPDNLTTWRMTAKATTADTQVGETTANITTWQPIIARPLLPRVLTAGDTAVLSTIIHNYSQDTQTVNVQLSIDTLQLTIDQPPTQTITLAPGGVQIVGWPVTAVEAGEVEILVTAVPQSGILGDAIQLPLTIQPLAVPDVQTQIGQFNTRLETTVNIPTDALPMSMVEIQLSRSIAGTLLEGLEYLTGYPYGCVEQTMSRALPNAVVGRALRQLGVTNPTLEAELPAYINASVQRLYGYQHNDGGWGWWYDDATHDYQTAWVIFGLAQVAEAGYEVDPTVIERGAAWLNENLSSMDARTRAFALYALAEAGLPNNEATLALADNVNLLQDDVFSLAGLALALDAIGQRTAAREIVDSLAETAITTNNLVHWEGSDQDGYYRQKTMASDIRSTALALSAFTQIRPGHALEGGMVRWLMGQRTSQGWGSTNETSFAILGLTDHLLAAAFNEAAANTNYTVSINGAVIASGALGPGAPAQTLQIPREQLRDGENVIVMTQDGGQTGGRPLYFTINSRVYVAQAEIEAAGVVTVNRVYLDPVTNKPLESVTAGQLVKVQLTVNLPENGSYLIIEDKLPGGLEALNEGLNTTSHIADEFEQYQIQDWNWETLGYNYKEIFGDRVSFFVTEMNAGRRTFTYYGRATMPGTFTAMPTEVYGMYNPTLWGRSASTKLVISARE
ncbi:MAG: Ig-like domain-containing protein [Anaerolineae bacterium]|nr:Ig-like domain-containing protein [Anaerolineae bacterium]